MDSNDAPTQVRYRQVVDVLRARLRSGQFGPDGRLPSELTLARELGVSRGTVRQALGLLLRDGVVQTVPGRGTFAVAGPSERAAEDQPPAAQRATAGDGRNPDGRLVGVVIPEVARMRVPELLGGIEGALRAAGYHLVLGGSGDWREQEAEQIERLVAQGIAGLIVYPVDGASNAPLLRRLRSGGLPIVLVDRYLPELEVDAVVADNIVGACQAVRHLLRVGRQRIGFVSTNNLGTSSIAERRAGYLLALEQLALEGGRPSVLAPSCRELRRLFRWPAGDHASRHNQAVLEQYLSRPDRPDAVFAVNDMVAFQVLEAAAHLGLRIPDDLAVVGFDNLSSPDYGGVPLTTVEQPREAIGRVAAELLHDAIGGRRTEPARVVLATRLIVRQSSVREAPDRRGSANPATARQSPLRRPTRQEAVGLDAPRGSETSIDDEGSTPEAAALIGAAGPSTPAT